MRILPVKVSERKWMRMGFVAWHELKLTNHPQTESKRKILMHNCEGECCWIFFLAPEDMKVKHTTIPSIVGLSVRDWTEYNTTLGPSRALSKSQSVLVSQFSSSVCCWPNQSRPNQSKKIKPASNLSYFKQGVRVSLFSAFNLTLWLVKLLSKLLQPLNRCSLLWNVYAMDM